MCRVELLAVDARYRHIVVNRWHLRVSPDRWTEDLCQRVLLTVSEQDSQKHPQTLPLSSQSGEEVQLFVKIYHVRGVLTAVKDWFRASKAFRFLNQGVALSRAGFLAPIVIAAGEERRLGFLLRAFVVTAAINGLPLPVLLKNSYSAGQADIPLSVKRNGIKALAQEIRRFHDLGFVHGDLVPSNIMVSLDPADGFRFYFMDNDRTRRYPKWLPHGLWRRNLVQLNRLPLPAISLQDRMRFFRTYRENRPGGRTNDRLLHWLEAKTRRRRKQCDHVDEATSFRRLMSWSGEVADHG